MSDATKSRLSGGKKIGLLVVIAVYLVGAFWLAKGVHHHNDAIRAIEDALAKAPALLADGSPSPASQGQLSGETAVELARRWNVGLEPTTLVLDGKTAIAGLRHEMEGWRLVLALVHFLGLAWILATFVGPILKDFLASQAERVKKDMADAEAEHAAARADHEAFRAVLDRFDADVEALREDERERGRREAEEIVLSADRAVKVIEGGCQDCLAKALEDARNAVKARFAQAARDRVAAELAEELDDAARAAIMDAGLQRLEEVTWTRS